MDNIKIKELIISCEACGTVKKFEVNSQVECEQIFHNFRCENNCGRSLYSFIQIGTLERKQLSIPIELKHAATVE